VIKIYRACSQRSYCGRFYYTYHSYNDYDFLQSYKYRKIYTYHVEIKGNNTLDNYIGVDAMIKIKHCGLMIASILLDDFIKQAIPLMWDINLKYVCRRIGGTYNVG